MKTAEWPRPCPIPGHPAGPEDSSSANPVTGSAWSRVRSWHLTAPAERLPLPLILTGWPAGWLLHQAGAPVLPVTGACAAATVTAWLNWRRHQKKSGHPRLAAAEAAAVTAAGGGWLAAAAAWGPLAGTGHLLTWVYVGGTGCGYVWLHQHHAVRAAAQRRAGETAWAARKAEWHRVAHEIGLGGTHLLNATPTYLGEDILVDLPPDMLASVIARHGSAIAEKYLRVRGLPYGRIDITTTDYPGQLLISIRTIDPAEAGSTMHPALDPGSPHAARFTGKPSIRNPIPVMVVPETGDLLEIELWDKYGGKAGGIYAKTGFGKTTLLNAVRERVTLMDDAVLLQINAAKMGDELAWGPLAAGTSVGPAAAYEKIQAKILGALHWVRAEITRRSETSDVTGDSVFQPTPDDPAIVVIIDEIDEVAKIPGATEALEFIASKQRSASVSLIIAGQSPDQRRTGGGMVRINMAWLLIGVVDRAGEARKATGAEMDIPDIREYARGERGFFQLYDNARQAVTGRGRGLQMGHQPGRELDEIKKKIIAPRVAAGIRRALPGPPMADAVLPQAAQAQAGRDEASSMHARIAGIQAQTQQQGADARPAQAPPRPLPARTVPAVPGVPYEQMPVLMGLLAAPHGTTAGEAAMATGVSKTAAHEWLAAMRRHGIADLNRAGRSSRWRLTAQPGAPATQAPQEGFTTVHALAEAVHAGLVQVDDTVRALLDQAREIEARTPASRGLFAVPDTPGLRESGDAQ